MIEMVIESQRRDLGGFEVGRVLPFAKKRMVGPFVFLDHMGPAAFAPGQGIDVRPHPHIGLSTVTYLFDGQIFHQDNLGYEQAIHALSVARGRAENPCVPGDALQALRIAEACDISRREGRAVLFRHRRRDGVAGRVVGTARTLELDGAEPGRWAGAGHGSHLSLGARPVIFIGCSCGQPHNPRPCCLQTIDSSTPSAVPRTPRRGHRRTGDRRPADRRLSQNGHKALSFRLSGFPPTPAYRRQE